MQGSIGESEESVSFIEFQERVENLAKKAKKAYSTGKGLKFNRWTDCLFSWMLVDNPPAVKIYDQGKADDCWTYAFSTGFNYLKAALVSPFSTGFDYLKAALVSRKEDLTPEMIMDGVSKRHLNSNGGLDLLENASDFMVNEDLRLSEMNVYGRDADEDLDELVVDRLAKGPVVVSIHKFPSYPSKGGQGTYNPSETDIATLAYERISTHVVVITGIGLQFVDGEIIKFFEYQNSYGLEWGVRGFGRFTYGRDMISSVVAFEL